MSSDPISQKKKPQTTAPLKPKNSGPDHRSGHATKSKKTPTLEQYEAKEGDSAWKILQVTGRNPSEQISAFISLNRNRYPKDFQRNPPIIHAGKIYFLPPKPAPPPPPKPKMTTLPSNPDWSSLYTIEPKDTPERIQEISGIPWEIIARINGLNEFNPGDLILLPPPPLESPFVIRIVSPSQVGFQHGSSGFQTVEKDPQKGFSGGHMYLGNDNNLKNYLINKDLWVTTKDGSFGYPKDPKHQAIFAVKGNEGDFSAINTYGKDILAIGIFQWTLQSGGAQKLLALMPHGDFNRHFRSRGIDVIEEDGIFKITFLGVIIEGKALEFFRNEWFALIFSQAGEIPSFQDAQFTLAERRLEDALDQLPNALRHFPISSEAMASILDQHVQRPANLRDIFNEMAINPQVREDTFLEIFNKTRLKISPNSKDRIKKIKDFFQKIRQYQLHS